MSGLNVAHTPMPRAAKPAQMSTISSAVPPPRRRHQDRITARERRGIGRVQLHAVGHELQESLIAGGEAEPRDEPCPDLEQRHAPDLADVVHFVRRADEAGRKRAVGQVDLQRIDVSEGQRIVRFPVGPTVVLTAYGNRRMP